MDQTQIVPTQPLTFNGEEVSMAAIVVPSPAVMGWLMAIVVEQRMAQVQQATIMNELGCNAR